MKKDGNTSKDLIIEIIKNSLLIPEDKKVFFISNIDNPFFKNDILDFLIAFWEDEKKVLSSINEEFPSIIKQMTSYIENKSWSKDKSEAQNLVNELNNI